MLETIIWVIIIGLLLNFIVPRITPKSIRVIFLEFGANRLYKTASKKLEKAISEEVKNNKNKKSWEDKKILDNLISTRNEAEETREKYIKLSERFRHDSNKRFEIISDWRDYAQLFYDWTEGYEDIQVSRGAVVPDIDRVQEIYLRSQEIIKRFDKLLSEKDS